MGRLLALDLGQAIIGCAVSDERHILATPLPPLLRNEGSLRLRKIRNLLRQYAIECILVGYPLSLHDGIRGKQARKIKAYYKRLKRHFSDTAVELVDERLSTWAVREGYSRLHLEKGGESPLNVDSFAAMEILEAYLREKEGKARPVPIS